MFVRPKASADVSIEGEGRYAMREILWRHQLRELNGNDKPAHLRICLSPRHFRNGSVRVETAEILISYSIVYALCHTWVLLPPQTYRIIFTPQAHFDSDVPKEKQWTSCLFAFVCCLYTIRKHRS